MKKAQSMIEVSLILVLVVVVSLALWPMFNNQKTKIAELSKSNVSTQSISGRQILLKNNALDLASEMGLAVNKTKDSKAILEEIKSKIDELSKIPNPDASQLALIRTYTSQYQNLSNELASINSTSITITDNTTIAGAQGGRVASIPITTTGTPGVGSSSVSRTDFTGKYSRQLPAGQGPQQVNATGSVANDDTIEETRQAETTTQKP